MPLYAHEPQSLLALLEPLLPYSLSIVGTIHTTLSTGKPLQQVYTSFPDITSPPEQWLAVVALPPPAVQIRLFHTLEAESDPDAQAINAAAELVAAAVTEIKLLHPQNYKTGAIHLLWCPAVRAVVGGPDGSPTMTYLAPNELPSPPAADTRGLVLDHGREGDEHLIYSKNQYRTPEYYASRAQETTAYRTEEGTLAAWIITNLDGSLGALYTLPEYRRRGLARALVAEHLRRHSRSVRGYCHIEVGNTASETMWSALGWTPAWTVKWLYA